MPAHFRPSCDPRRPSAASDTASTVVTSDSAAFFDAATSVVPLELASAHTSGGRGWVVVNRRPRGVFVATSVAPFLSSTHDAPEGSESTMPGVSVSDIASASTGDTLTRTDADDMPDWRVVSPIASDLASDSDTFEAVRDERQLAPDRAIVIMTAIANGLHRLPEGVDSAPEAAVLLPDLVKCLIEFVVSSLYG